MSSFLAAVAVFLILNLGGGLVRVIRGPTPFDRMVAGQLFGTVGVAVLLLLAQTSGAPDLRLVALVFALLSAVVSVAFVKRGWVRLDEERHGPSENGSADA